MRCRKFPGKGGPSVLNLLMDRVCPVTGKITASALTAENTAALSERAVAVWTGQPPSKETL